MLELTPIRSTCRYSAITRRVFGSEVDLKPLSLNAFVRREHDDYFGVELRIVHVLLPVGSGREVVRGAHVGTSQIRKIIKHTKQLVINFLRVVHGTTLRYVRCIVY